MIVNNLLICRAVSTVPTKFRQFHRVSTVKNFITTQHFDNTLKNNFYERPVHITSVKGTGVRCISSTSRSNSASETMCNTSMNVDYEGLSKAQKDDNVLIIDVRENSEIQETGKLPGSIHIPMGEVPSAFNLSSQEFENKYHKKKPTVDDKIILSCRSGKRSAMVQSELQKLGYKKALNFDGGWLEWESHQNV